MTTNRWVIAAPKKHHGLGNRVRAVLGARALARATGRRFRYAWPVGTEFGARFDELWEVSDRTIPVVLSRALTLRYPYQDHTLEWLDDAATRRVWQIRTAHALHLPPGAGPWESELQGLQPAPEIRHAVRRFHATHLAGRPYLGVMVRAHPMSHAETLAASPVDWFVDRLSLIRSRHPDIPFFVSTDTEEALARIQKDVPGCLSLTGKGAYNSRDGLRSAVTDLYLLAASAHLIGPHFSSFPELAQHLAGPGMRLETSRTTPAESLEAASLTQPPDPVTPHIRRPVRLT